MAELFELSITATGEVRDADGKLISTEPVEITATVTEEQATALIANQEEMP